MVKISIFPVVLGFDHIYLCISRSWKISKRLLFKYMVKHFISSLLLLKWYFSKLDCWYMNWKEFEYITKTFPEEKFHVQKWVCFFSFWLQSQNSSTFYHSSHHVLHARHVCYVLDKDLPFQWYSRSLPAITGFFN